MLLSSSGKGRNNPARFQLKYYPVKRGCNGIFSDKMALEMVQNLAKVMQLAEKTNSDKPERQYTSKAFILPY